MSGIDQPEEVYSVWQFFEDDTYEQVRSMVSAEEAMLAAKHYCTSVGAKLGFVERVIITDSLDFTVFEWKKGKGITFPPANEGEGK